MEAPDSYDFSDIVQMRTQEAFKFQAPKKKTKEKKPIRTIVEAIGRRVRWKWMK